MAAGFRKSFLGYNCDDVLKYIEKTTHENNERELIAKEKIAELQAENDNFKSKNLEMSAEIEAIKAKLNEYEAKADEINRMSEGIGRLYLVSKTNAQDIIDAANNSSSAVIEQVKRNIEIIDNAHTELFTIRTSVESNAANFSKSLSDLESSLSDVKDNIEKNSSEIEKKNSEFNSVMTNM